MEQIIQPNENMQAILDARPDLRPLYDPHTTPGFRKLMNAWANIPEEDREAAEDAVMKFMELTPEQRKSILEGSHE